MKAFIALFIFLSLAVCLSAKKNVRAQPEYINNKEISPERVDQIMDFFRSAKLTNDFAFRFEMKHLPRRGKESIYLGQIWGSWNEKGPLNRVRLWPRQKSNNKEIGQVDMLSQNGVEATLWINRAGEKSKTVKIDGENLFEPLYENLIFTPFDIQMPFIYWQDHVYEGSTRMKGRSAHQLLLYPPEDFSEQYPDIGGVRVTLDAEFSAMLKAEIISPDGELIKTFKINSVKKVNKEWIVKTIDLLDEKTRNKTRLKIVAAAVNLDLSESVFNITQLGNIPSEISPDKFKFF